MTKKFAPKSYFIYKIMFDNSIKSADIGKRGKANQGIAQTTLTDIFNQVPQTSDQFERLTRSINAKLPPTSAKLVERQIYYDGEETEPCDKVVNCLIGLKSTEAVTRVLTEAVKSSNVGMDCKPVGYALLLLDHDHDEVAANKLARAQSGLIAEHQTFVDQLLSLVKQSKARDVSKQATFQEEEEVDPITVHEEVQKTRGALLAYAKSIVEKDTLAVETIAAHYGFDRTEPSTLAKSIERLFANSEEGDGERHISRPFEEILKLARKNPDKVKEFQTETIRVIRNIAICLSFPDELCKQACKEKLKHLPIRIPTDEIEWAKLFIGRVLGTFAKSVQVQSKPDRPLLERLNLDGESMIDIPIEMLVPSLSEMVDPPRDTGPNSALFLADLCLGIANHLRVDCKKDELLHFFEEWNGESHQPECVSIERLHGQFAIWKIFEAHLLVMVPARRPRIELLKIRKLFESIQFLEAPVSEHNNIANLRFQIRYFDNMTNDDKPT